MNPATIQCMLEETPRFPSLSQNLTDILLAGSKFHFEKAYWKFHIVTCPYSVHLR